MADEPRRSGRATKGQHNKNASASPAPQPKPKQPKSKPTKKKQETQASEENYDDEEEVIRCICGNDNPNDKRAFIFCESCQAWQHNVCMGITDDDDELPEHYFCEECHPEEHRETLQAMERGEKIWEVRNKIFANEKKMSRNRKGKSAGPGWLKKDVPPPSEATAEQTEVAAEEGPETGTKRKREDTLQSQPSQIKAEEVEDKPTRGSRQEKRRKSAMEGPGTTDPETALVDMEKLPSTRKKIAQALANIIDEDLSTRSPASIPAGITGQSLALRIEYSLKMNLEGPENPKYTAQFRMLNANLKKNKALIASLLDGSLTADELSMMESKDMASEELQKERAAMKEQLDRQAVAIQAEGPKYRSTHKGVELIEDENRAMAGADSSSTTTAQPLRERTSVADEGTDAMSPTAADRPPTAGSPSKIDSPAFPLRVDTARPSNASLPERRSSSQQFDINNVWAKTAHSPTSSTANPLRPMQQPARRRSSMAQQQQQTDGTKDDADVDRMLQDDEDETYSPAEYAGEDGIVWHGKLIQSADGVSPTVNARFVAGRDLGPTVRWQDLLPDRLSIDGRLAIDKAEEYLCSLQWSHTSDVSVLALTPHDDADAFEKLFEYFRERKRYAVVNKDKPPMIKDLYIAPIEAGQALPEHVGMLEFCRLKNVVEEKCLLASLVVARAPGTPKSANEGAVSGSVPVPQQQQPAVATGQNGQHLPAHVRAAPGPAGSPLNSNSGTFSPGNMANGSGQQAYGGGIPPSPYSGQTTIQQPGPASQGHPNPLVDEILGPLQNCPTARQVLAARPNIEREKLEHLKFILEEDPSARTDVNVLADKLFGGRV